jgi:AcrR family transcriptional regulator
MWKKEMMTKPPKPTQPGRKEASEAMRSKLLESAAKILANEGISGLTARRLSAAAGASTKVVYNHFGGMPGVIAALYDQGFTLLAAYLAQRVILANQSEKVAAIAKAYRGFALGNADLFDLMYGPTVAILLPTPDTRASAIDALSVVIDAFAELGMPNAENRARAFWAAIHGVVALERTGWFDDDEAMLRLNAVIDQFQRPEG